MINLSFIFKYFECQFRVYVFCFQLGALKHGRFETMQYFWRQGISSMGVRTSMDWRQFAMLTTIFICKFWTANMKLKNLLPLFCTHAIFIYWYRLTVNHITCNCFRWFLKNMEWLVSVAEIYSIYCTDPHQNVNRYPQLWCLQLLGNLSQGSNFIRSSHIAKTSISMTQLFELLLQFNQNYLIKIRIRSNSFDYAFFYFASNSWALKGIREIWLTSTC